MKRKFILLPITLTALSPAISLVGCNKWHIPPTPKGAIELKNWTIQKLFEKRATLRCPIVKTGQGLVKYRAILDLNLTYQYNYGSLKACFGGSMSEIDQPTSASGMYTDSCSFKQKTSAIVPSDVDCYYNLEPEIGTSLIEFAHKTMPNERIVIDFTVDEEEAISDEGRIEITLSNSLYSN